MFRRNTLASLEANGSVSLPSCPSQEGVLTRGRWDISQALHSALSANFSKACGSAGGSDDASGPGGECPSQVFMLTIIAATTINKGDTTQRGSDFSELPV